jgi:hypothetical protein
MPAVFKSEANGGGFPANTSSAVRTGDSWKLAGSQNTSRAEL